jgi:hypothetical protein
MKRFGLIGLAWLCSQVMWADVFNYRPLPIINLNSGAGTDRSNISFSESDPRLRFNGDDFTLPGGQDWVIRSIITWSVASVDGEALGQEFNSVSLYGRVNGVMTSLLSGTPNTSFDGTLTNTVFNSNANILHRRVQYDNGQNLELYDTVPTGIFYPVWQNVFTGLDWRVKGGEAVEFGVWGTGATLDPLSGYGYWFNHMSNRLLSGNLQSGADNGYLVYDFANLGGPALFRNPSLGGGVDINGSPVPLWDKGADMNILIIADPLAIPEPGSIALTGIGLAAVALLARKR